jgi:uncharacterized protein (TIGR03437 family)
VNGASFRSDQPVTQGSWVSAKGTFSGVSDTIAPGYPLPKTLGGVTVSVDGVDAPIYFVSASQINFLIPYQTAAGLRNVQVKTGSGTVNGKVRVISAAPGLFIKDTSQQVPPKGAILNEDSSENTSSNLARRGRVISIYATGPGALDQTLEDGAAAPSQEPFARTKSTPQVYIGNVLAQIQFSGLAPTFAGLWQINAVVPDQPFVTGRVPVQVFMDGVDSNEVAVFVAP